ncbi:MAG: FtsQ-type POTRA domain-containing protein [Candidatus Moranbacteria bacterium]|nr:FtsQ-type POTRA domain-containing protein [Candidatus Moranbacteria bacterium]
MFNFSSKNKNRKVVRTLSNSANGGRVIAAKKKSTPTRVNSPLLIKILMRFLALVFLGVTIYILFFSQFVVVNSVVVSGTQNVDSQSVATLAMETIQGKSLGLFMKNNIILVSEQDIQSALENKFKRIENVEIVRQFPDKLLIRIKERESLLVFCSGEPCWVIDKNGHAYAQADFEANELGEKDLSILRDLSQKDIGIENFRLDVRLARFIVDVKNRLEQDLDIRTKQECQTKMLVSGDLEFETTSGWKIYFSYDIGENKSIEMLKTALQNALDKDKQANLEYIDLRLNNKVYYKLKNEVIATETEPVAVPVVAPAFVPVVEKKKK